MAEDIRARRQALGWSRSELGRRAQVDKSVLQLLEMSLSEDEESAARVEAALAAGEAAAASNNGA